MLATRRFHHRAKSAHRRRQLSADILKGPSHETCHYVGVGARACRVHHCRRERAGLPVPHGHRGGAISSRRIGRWRRAHPGPEAQRDDGPTLHRRESSRRCLGHRRRQRCRQGGSHGHSLLLSASVHVINPLLYKSVPYDVVHDFTPVALLAEGPLIVSTTPSVPANNLRDLFALVRKDPQKYTFGATTIGSASHLAIELLKLDAGLDTLVVAYKGTAPALTDLMSGQIQLLADPLLSSLPLAQGGKIKALGLTSLKRAAAAPEIPTVAESGVTGFAFVSWYGLWGPKNLPADLSNALQADVAKVLALPDVKQRLNALGFDPIGSGGEQFATYIRDEMAKYEKIIKDAKIKVE